MQAFTKLFQSIITSSIWSESDQTRLMWITLLALKDRDGEVYATIGGLAHVARIPLIAAQEAIDILMAPDPNSRCPDNEGRRIERIEGGWRILNHEYYRKLARKDYERHLSNERQKRWRMKCKIQEDLNGEEKS